MTTSRYLVFGDLHGRILPAFRLACAWALEHNIPLSGILQVGDLGYFPDLARLDKATKRHAEIDPLELGALDVAAPSPSADRVFAEPECPEALWFTAGNHEDFIALKERASASDAVDFAVDAYDRVRCVRDGRVATLTDGLRVAALWGIDDKAPNARRNTPPEARIKDRSATRLSGESFDALLTHEAPRDAVYADAGSEAISALIDLARPAVAFFGHYDSDVRDVHSTRGPTRVYHLHGFELRRHGGCAEPGSVGLLRRDDHGLSFEYLDGGWLKTFTRHNWKHR